MKKWLMVLCCTWLIVGCATKENDSHEIDPVATAKAPWKVGDKAVVYSSCPSIFANYDTCYAIFLGITKKGNALLQDYYETGEKLTAPYEYPFEIELIRNPDTRKFNTVHPEGLWLRYYKNGKKMDEVNYINGQINGFSRQWYENGQLTYEAEVRNGIEQGSSNSWYENGQQWAHYTCVDGKWHGPYTFWYENGQIKEEGSYQDTFSPIGIWRYWDEQGNLIEEKDYGAPK